MKMITGQTNQLDRSDTWIPVLNGWLSSRNLDTMTNKKFREWFAEHDKQVAKKHKAETAAKISEACCNAANKEGNR